MAATALVIPFEACESAVGRWRRKYTGDGREGMPAHVTLLYPWVDENALTAASMAQLQAIVSGCRTFDVSFGSFGRFDGSPSALFLKPRPSEPFVELTNALADAFPDHPPYGGAHREIVPHLTIVHTVDAGILAEAERAVSGALPLQAIAAEVRVMTHRPGEGWVTAHALALPTG